MTPPIGESARLSDAPELKIDLDGHHPTPHPTAFLSDRSYH
ncbi:MAG: hypothetical protein AAFV53_17275 [Myxococcota bacterium]